MTWHTAFWDDDAATGVVEYSYEGHHRYHGAAIVRIGADDRIARWREWQHLDDVMAWDARLRGPADSEHHEVGLAFDQGADRRSLLGRRRW